MQLSLNKKVRAFLLFVSKRWLVRESATGSLNNYVGGIHGSFHALFQRSVLNQIGQKSTQPSVTSTVQVNDFFLSARNDRELVDLVLRDDEGFTSTLSENDSSRPLGVLLVQSTKFSSNLW